jgi:glycosyltransferase involved in cell wall biosynthesis
MKQPIVVVFGGIWTNEQMNRLAENTTPYFKTDDNDLEVVLKEIQPHVLLTVGVMESYLNMGALPTRYRVRWLHFTDPEDLLEKYNQIYFCFVNWAIKYRNDPDMVTVFSTSYNSRDYIKRPFNTLMTQTYPHWEWIIFDDSNGDENWANLVKLREADPRIRVYRAEKNSGVIGHMKNLASSLARGGLLIEVDHDDELTPRALELCVTASHDFPEAGFFHSDFVEIHEDGTNFKYGDHFGLGWGSYRKEWSEERKMWVNVCNTIPINTATIRYLVGCPNHFRAWRTSFFNEVGGWNPHFHVADDYEMMARSFLKTKFVKIRHNCYYQYRNAGGNNHTFIRNKEIQKLWYTISRYYNNQFNQRFKELGVEDLFFETWDKHGQWQKCWLNDTYDQNVCETMKVRGRDPLQPLVAVALVCYSKDDVFFVKDAIETVLRQSYDELQITVVGNCVPEFEIFMDNIVNIWEQENKNAATGANAVGEGANVAGEGSSGDQLINIDRAKRDLRWWNIDRIYWYRACLNYICKASSEGEFVCYLDAKNISQVESFYQNNFIKMAIDMMNADSQLDMVYLKDTTHFIHRRSLYERFGYWSVKKDLFELFKREVKCQAI